MEYWVESAFRPLRHYADFRGRSTRTELVAFYVLTGVIAVGIAYVTGMILLVQGAGPWRTVQAAAQIPFLCPTLALFVRRLHDQGKSGFWLFLLLPFLAVVLWQYYAAGFSLDPLAELKHPIPVVVEVIALFPSLLFLALMLWEDEKGANRYGPNPRRNSPIEPEAAPDSGGAQPL